MFICIVLISVYLDVKNENVKPKHIQPHTPSVVQSDTSLIRQPLEKSRHLWEDEAEQNQ